MYIVAAHAARLDNKTARLNSMRCPHSPEKKNSSPTLSLSLSLSPSLHPYLFLSIHLVAMPIPSKIVPPYAVSSRENESHSVYAGSQHSRTFSPPPDRKRLSAFPEHEHDISHLSGSLSAYNHASRPYASTSAHHRTSYYADSPSAPSRHHSGVSPTLENRRSHSHISISSDSHHTEATELLELRTENDQLKQKIRYLQGRVESITCILILLDCIHGVDGIFPCRDAYTTLVGGLSETIDDTKDKVQKMVHHISTNFTGQIPGVEAPGIPLNPKQVDHKLLRYWNNEPWQAIRNRSKIKDSDSPILSLFFEDEFGQLVSNDTKNEIRGDLYSYWADMLSEGEMPGPYKHMGFKRKEDYRKTMEGKFPWLRLCEGHWKVKQIWTNHLNTWKRKHGNSNKSTASNDPKQKTPGSNKPKHTTPIELPSSEGDALSNSDDPEHNTPIEIPSSDDRIPTGSKRAREDEGDSDAGSLKKHKGKEKAIATPGFHPTRPQPKKKITAKITTVSNCLFPFIKDLPQYLGGPIVFVFLFCPPNEDANYQSQRRHTDHVNRF